MNYKNISLISKFDVNFHDLPQIFWNMPGSIFNLTVTESLSSGASFWTLARNEPYTWAEKAKT